MLEDKLSQDLKQAMLDRNTDRVETLRSLKGAILNAKVAEGTRGQSMPDEKVTLLLQKQAKQRQESADLFTKGGNDAKAQAELAEKAIIEEYLPKQLTEAELRLIVDEVVNQIGASGAASMGGVIGAVKQRVAGSADGAIIARVVKERLS